MKRMQADLIYLVKGIDAGRNAWYYVLVERLKLQLFLIYKLLLLRLVLKQLLLFFSFYIWFIEY